jgi:hypothetical protein
MVIKNHILVPKHCFFLLVFTSWQTIALAQNDQGGSSDAGSGYPSKTEVNSTTQGDWYTSPWIWVIGAAVFILLLALISGGGRRSEGRTGKVSDTKTVGRDADV